MPFASPGPIPPCQSSICPQHPVASHPRLPLLLLGPQVVLHDEFYAGLGAQHLLQVFLQVWGLRLQVGGTAGGPTLRLSGARHSLLAGMVEHARTEARGLVLPYREHSRPLFCLGQGDGNLDPEVGVA